MYELERKARVRDRESAIAQVLAAGGTLLSEVEQTDRIFVPPATDITAPGPATTVLRVRVQGEVATFTFKRHRTSESDREELELEISSPEAMSKILLGLGFEPVVTVRKRRTTLRLAEFTVCVDDVEHLGTFVEVELLLADPPSTVDFGRLDRFFASFTDGEPVHKSYDRLLLEAGCRDA